MTMSDPVFEAIGLALLHLLWQGALVAGVLAATLHLIDRKNAAMRYALSCLALGGQGFLSSEGNLAPRLCVSVVEAYGRADFAAAETAYGDLSVISGLDLASSADD